MYTLFWGVADLSTLERACQNSIYSKLKTFIIGLFDTRVTSHQISHATVVYLYIEYI
jgi:hypothetical protein